MSTRSVVAPRIAARQAEIPASRSRSLAMSVSIAPRSVAKSSNPVVSVGSPSGFCACIPGGSTSALTRLVRLDRRPVGLPSDRLAGHMRSRRDRRGAVAVVSNNHRRGKASVCEEHRRSPPSPPLAVERYSDSGDGFCQRTRERGMGSGRVAGIGCIRIRAKSPPSERGSYQLRYGYSTLLYRLFDSADLLQDSEHVPGRP